MRPLISQDMRSLIERCCVEECNSSFPWKYVIRDAELSNIQGESMSAYNKCQLLPLDMLLCYNLAVPVRKDRLQDLPSLLTKTFSNFFPYFLCHSSCISSPRLSSFVRFMWAFRAALTIRNNLHVCFLSHQIFGNDVFSPISLFLLLRLFLFNLVLMLSHSGKCFLGYFVWKMYNKGLRWWIANAVLSTGRILELAAKARGGWKAEM